MTKSRLLSDRDDPNKILLSIPNIKKRNFEEDNEINSKSKSNVLLDETLYSENRLKEKTDRRRLDRTFEEKSFNSISKNSKQKKNKELDPYWRDQENKLFTMEK